jgi:hypothetical protein
MRIGYEAAILIGIHINAIAPVFFSYGSNRGLIFQEDGEFCDRANKILSQTPLERFGESKELVVTYSG